jgi:secretion/DNA translocation related CpaE-like protein
VEIAMAPPPRPLCITDDPDLLEEVLNLATDIGIDIEVAADPASVRQSYSVAPFVMIGDRSTVACARASLPRRSGVLVVTQNDQVDRLRPVARLLGAERVVRLPQGVDSLIDRFTAAADLAATGDGRVVAVLGGRGGAGASVLAAGLAVTAGRAGLRALLVDADPLGGGVDLVLGWEELNGLRWPALADTKGAVDAPALVEALPSRGDLAVLSCARADFDGLSAEAMASALEAGRMSRDLIVADLPRRLDEAAALALRAADRALLVVPAELRACAAAARVAAAASVHTAALELIVRGPAPGRLRTREIARALDMPVAGTLRAEPNLSRGLERGTPPAGSGRGPLAALCRRLIGELGLGDRAVEARTA